MSATQYIGARYVPVFADPAEWSSENSYEPLTIVLHNGNSYTSAQYVPIGIDIENDSYWKLTGNFNSQVEQYRSEVKTFDARITTADTTANDALSLAQTNEKDIAALDSEMAGTADSGLKTLITNNADSIAAETVRAEAAEVINANAITNESQRAIAVENSKTFIVKTVDDLKNSNLALGSTAKTLGYYNENDNGGAFYTIVNTAIANELNIITLANGNYAVLQSDVSSPNILQYGAKLNDTSYASINDSVLNLLNSSECYIQIPAGTLYISKTFDATKVTLDCVGWISPTENFTPDNIPAIIDEPYKTHFADYLESISTIKPIIKIGLEDGDQYASASMKARFKHLNIKVDGQSMFLTGVYINNIASSNISVNSWHCLQYSCYVGSEGYENTLALNYRIIPNTNFSIFKDTGEGLTGLYCRTSDIYVSNVEGYGAMCGLCGGHRAQFGVVHVYTGFYNNEHPALSVSVITTSGIVIRRLTCGDKIALYTTYDNNLIKINEVRWVIGDYSQRFIKIFDSNNNYKHLNKIIINTFNVRLDDSVITTVTKNYKYIFDYILCNFYDSIATISGDKIWNNKNLIPLCSIDNYISTNNANTTISLSELIESNKGITFFNIPFKKYNLNVYNASTEQIKSFFGMELTTLGTDVNRYHMFEFVNYDYEGGSTISHQYRFLNRADSKLYYLTTFERYENTESSSTPNLNCSSTVFGS